MFTFRSKKAHFQRKEPKTTRDFEWREFTDSMRGLPVEEKLHLLVQYLKRQKFSQEAQIRVTNYYLSLKRYGSLRD